MQGHGQTKKRIVSNEKVWPRMEVTRLEEKHQTLQGKTKNQIKGKNTHRLSPFLTSTHCIEESESFFWKVWFLLHCKLAVLGFLGKFLSCAKFSWALCISIARNSCKKGESTS